MFLVSLFFKIRSNLICKTLNGFRISSLPYFSVCVWCPAAPRPHFTPLPMCPSPCIPCISKLSNHRTGGTQAPGMNGPPDLKAPQASLSTMKAMDSGAPGTNTLCMCTALQFMKPSKSGSLALPKPSWSHLAMIFKTS